MAALPVVSNLFTDDIALTSLTFSGGLVTATTTAAHGKSTGDKVSVISAINPIVISTMTRSGTVGSAETASDNDLSLSTPDIRNGKTVTLSGAAEGEFNGTFILLSVVNRRNFTFVMVDSGPTTATGSPVIEDGSQLPGFNGRHAITVTGATIFTYPVTQALASAAIGTPVIKAEARVSGAITLERAIDSYTSQNSNELWAFVIIGDVIASKNRSVNSDMTDTLTSTNGWKQRITQPFTVYIFSPATSSLSGRDIRDSMEDVSLALFKSLLGAKFPTGYFASEQFVTTFVNHGFNDYNTAYYVHEFNFEMAADITFDDTIGYGIDVAFRDVDLSITSDQGTGIDPATANVNLDETPL